MRVDDVFGCFLGIVSSLDRDAGSGVAFMTVIPSISSSESLRLARVPFCGGTRFFELLGVVEVVVVAVVAIGVGLYCVPCRTAMPAAEFMTFGSGGSSLLCRSCVFDVSSSIIFVLEFGFGVSSTS